MNRTSLKLVLVILLLFIHERITTPIAYELDPDIYKRLAKEYILEKRETELNEFNIKLKQEHPELFVLAMRESALTHIGDSVPNYKVYNKYGYIGAWQIHVSYLERLGIYGVTFEEFKNDPDGVFPFELQLQAISVMIKRNINHLGWMYDYYPGKIVYGVKVTEEGMIYAAHLGGAGGLKKFFKYGRNPKDANGVSIKDYLDYKNTFWYHLDT